MIKLNGKIPLIDKQNTINTNENEIKIIFTGLRPGEKLIEELIYKTKFLRLLIQELLKLRIIYAHQTRFKHTYKI